jgi:hypothetical protein
MAGMKDLMDGKWAGMSVAYLVAQLVAVLAVCLAEQ